MRRITITVEVTKAARKTVEVPDEDFDALMTDAPEDVPSVNEAIENLYTEAESGDPECSVEHNYQITDDADRIIVDYD